MADSIWPFPSVSRSQELLKLKSHLIATHSDGLFPARALFAFK